MCSSSPLAVFKYKYKYKKKKIIGELLRSFIFVLLVSGQKRSQLTERSYLSHTCLGVAGLALHDGPMVQHPLVQDRVGGDRSV